MWEDTVEDRKGSDWMRIESWWGCEDKDLDITYQFL